jgi:hypothetical protein
MSAEWLTAIGTVGTFVVITASAVAALLQLRHMRGSNQIAALNDFTKIMASGEMKNALHFISAELPGRLADPVERKRALTIPFTNEYEAISFAANAFENIGGFVRTKVIDPDTACSVIAGPTVRYWRALLPVTTYVREQTGTQAVWENFEYLALISTRWQQAHPHGTYPKNEPRMPQDRSLLEQEPA